MQRVMLRKQLAPSFIRGTSAGLRPVSTSFAARRTIADSSTSADNISKPQSQDQAPQDSKEAPNYQNYMVAGGAVALGALGYYYYLASGRKDHKKLANVATAGSVISHTNPEFEKSLGRGSKPTSTGA